MLILPFAPRMLPKPTKLKWMDGVKPLRYWSCYYERDPRAQFLREKALVDMNKQNEFWEGQVSKTVDNPKGLYYFWYAGKRK